MLVRVFVFTLKLFSLATDVFSFFDSVYTDRLKTSDCFVACVVCGVKHQQRRLAPLVEKKWR